jgi:hypothetical protein
MHQPLCNLLLIGMRSDFYNEAKERLYFRMAAIFLVIINEWFVGDENLINFMT